LKDKLLISINLFLAVNISQSCFAQTQQQFEHALDKVDNSKAWSTVPVSKPTTTVSPRQAVRRQVMKTLMESQSTGAAIGTGTARPAASGDSGSVYADWQKAENQASRARYYAQKARSDSSKSSRQSAASSADYAARAARYASDRVYQASRNGNPTGQQYAAKARAAADRARSDADRARYNADNYRGN
jgi:hypothetical protein